VDQALRNKLRGVVTQCRKILEDSTAQALQGRFGIYAARKKGEVQIEDAARMAHLTDEDCACRQDLLDHLEHIQTIGHKPSEALDQLVREIAFTHLNRLCAYKMMEARGLIREAVSRGLKSQGFFFYLADHLEDEKLHNGGQQEAAYRNFLDWLGGTLSEEMGILFNPNDPANRIYPPQRVLDEVLALINDGELKDIWSQDETIGWVYQYFTPKELRDKARKESQAPRNSYELAFRNQFFTPRYVVEFLTDNTLGRIWYEMHKGETSLKDRCRYLVRRPTEIFLKEGEEPPAESKSAHEDLSQEELLKQPVYIPHRPKKDPREIKVLDPACGSGHFLLYCFDLLQVIYEEAYDDPDLSAALRKDYPALEDLRRDVPGLILKHNLHGIDIDLRATQIAALALWLRCQRAYQELGLKNGERPKITRSNIVCAEPMPGETNLLKEFTATLQPKVLGQLVEVVFEKMKLAGEAGSLLKIEEEVRDAAMTAKKEYQEELWRQKEQAGYLPSMAPPRERTLFDFSDMTDSEFLDHAEEEIVFALGQYAEKASNGRGFRRRLFAEDAARGFAFVDLCHKRFDVVLMNPPFGDATDWHGQLLRQQYPISRYDLAACFVEHGLEWLTHPGCLGAITSRSLYFLGRFEEFRRTQLLSGATVLAFADLGLGVLDAFIDTSLVILAKSSLELTSHRISCFDAKHVETKGDMLVTSIHHLTSEELSLKPNAFVVSVSHFQRSPLAAFSFWSSSNVLKILDENNSLEANGIDTCVGLQTDDDLRFLRLAWEVRTSDLTRDWKYLAKGGEYSKFWDDIHLVINWKGSGEEVKAFVASLFGSASKHVQNERHYFRPGLSYPFRTAKGFNIRCLPRDCIFTLQGMAVFVPGDKAEILETLLGILNSHFTLHFLRMLTSADAYQVGYVRKLPCMISDSQARERVQKISHDAILIRQSLDMFDETCCKFHFPAAISAQKQTLRSSMQWAQELLRRAEKRLNSAISEINEILAQSWFPEKSEADEILAKYSEPPLSWNHSEPIRIAADNLLWSVGVAFGRWDLRNQFVGLTFSDPFDPLPVCPSGMLQGLDGLPAKPEDVSSNYPIRIDWDGILVDDPEHEDDIVRRVRDVLEVIWKDRAEAIEREACEMLGVRELRDYFRKPGNGGFWIDHVKRYSKSRRKAPIYWYLRSAKGNYGLWLYYHRLDKDILFKALLNYVEPKIRLEEDRLKTLRGRKEAAGSSGREAKQIEKDMDRQEQFVSELHDFADKLRRAADLHLAPDLNDGVVLNIAPLWELVPWKEAKKNWEELQEGKYDWSHIAYQLWPERVEELCKIDRSIAIAHGREDLYQGES